MCIRDSTVGTDAVVPVVSTGVLAVVCDSVVNVVGVVVVSVTNTHTYTDVSSTVITIVEHNIIYSETTVEINMWHS